jgi:hypothetical protein
VFKKSATKKVSNPEVALSAEELAGEYIAELPPRELLSFFGTPTYDPGVGGSGSFAGQQGTGQHFWE